MVLILINFILPIRRIRIYHFSEKGLIVSIHLLFKILYTQVGISGDLKLIKQKINSIMKLFQVNWAYWTEAKSLDIVKYTKQILFLFGKLDIELKPKWEGPLHYKCVPGSCPICLTLREIQ